MANIIISSINSTLKGFIDDNKNHPVIMETVDIIKKATGETVYDCDYDLLKYRTHAYSYEDNFLISKLLKYSDQKTAIISFLHFLPKKYSSTVKQFDDENYLVIIEQHKLIPNNFEEKSNQLRNILIKSDFNAFKNFIINTTPNFVDDSGNSLVVLITSNRYKIASSSNFFLEIIAHPLFNPFSIKGFDVFVTDYTVGIFEGILKHTLPTFLIQENAINFLEMFLDKFPYFINIKTPSFQLTPLAFALLEDNHNATNLILRKYKHYIDPNILIINDTQSVTSFLYEHLENSIIGGNL